MALENPQWMDNLFVCGLCGLTCRKGWTDEEALAEADASFGERLPDPVAVCDDCYRYITSQVPIADWVAERKAKGLPL